MKKAIRTILVIAAMPAVFTSCKKDDDTPEPTPSTLEVKTVSNLFANDSVGHYTFYNLRTNSVVNLTDSTTTNWDVAFFSTRILINGGVSGPGNGAAAVVSNGFDNVSTAPEDNLFEVDSANNALAIIPVPSSGWYNYAGAPTHVISPIPGRTIVVRTADGKYAKIEILSYYKDAPATPTMTDISRYYKFRYSIQTDGTKNLN